ncbi:hypothetical protein IQ07DRAFT_512882 [Pyrenochaeta sp. DS3sAY3a]|nr:hypothetical protein IQ07DRAFT_512882 [Pyrenochaeta sp. DS3sAY3a]
MPLIWRRLRCHYCNVQSRDSFAHRPQQYQCPHCDAVNHFDEHGNITYPPLERIATAPHVSFHRAPSRSPSPVMQAPAEDMFCDTCQHNQDLYNKMLAEYLPDDDDPEYAKFEAALEDYKIELEERYPHVCQACRPRVEEHIRNTQYAARADHLRRMLEKSDQKRKAVQTWRQMWTLCAISLAKWTYLATTGVWIIWHIFGLLMDPYERVWAGASFSWKTCIQQAMLLRSVGQCCVLCRDIQVTAWAACLADLLTLWWNPKLSAKTNSLTGRMHGLGLLWKIRFVVLMLRFGVIYYNQTTIVDNDTLPIFRYVHFFGLVTTMLSFASNWIVVRLVHHSPTLLRGQSQSNPSSTQSTPKKASSRSAHPQPTTFDMGQSFSSSMQDNDASAVPPSPTLSTSSLATDATESTMFSGRRAPSIDAMDWTPEPRRRFARADDPIVEARWSQAQSPTKPPPEKHSLFNKPDTNPFHHRVPAAPKAPAHARVDAWKPGVWQQPLPETKTNFFKDGGRTARASGTDAADEKGLEGIGVPRNVQRDADLFASPKLKYDYYGTPKDTGLEETFNGLFSK